MVVLLDNKEVMRTVDRAHDGPFDGFAVINKGGEFELKQVSILGTQESRNVAGIVIRLPRPRLMKPLGCCSELFLITPAMKGKIDVSTMS